MRVLFFFDLPQFPKDITFSLKVRMPCVFFLLLRVALKVKMSTERKLVDTEGKTEVLDEKPVTVPLSPSQIQRKVI
jgi:hypothetical protein